jgi:acetyltransferase-like isoleucine patch superfamily enzyme
MGERHTPNGLKSVSHAMKGFLANVAACFFYPPVLIAWLHCIRGVNFKNIRSVFISFNVCIDSVFPEHVFIGEDVWLTRNVVILAHFNPSNMQRTYLGDVQVKDTVIEDGVFIGVNAVILPGVTVGRGALVGAGSVVSKDVPPFSIVGGNPARVIRWLNDHDDKSK